MTYMHVIICDYCKKQEQTKYLNDTGWWLKPSGWKEYDDRQFCSPECVVDYIYSIREGVIHAN